MRRQLIKKIIKIVEMSDECFNHDIRIDNLRFCIKQNSTHKYYNMIVHYKKFYRIKTFYWPNNKVYSVFNDIVKEAHLPDGLFNDAYCTFKKERKVKRDFP